MNTQAVSTRPMITLPWTPSPHCIDGISVNSPWNPQTASSLQEYTTPWNPQTVSSLQEYTTPSSCQQKFFPGYNLAGGSSQSCTSEADITAAQPLTTSTYLPATKTTGYFEQSAPRYPEHPRSTPSYPAHTQLAPRYQHVSADSTTPESSSLTSNSQHEYQVFPQLKTQHPTCHFNLSYNTLNPRIVHPQNISPGCFEISDTSESSTYHTPTSTIGPSGRCHTTASFYQPIAEGTSYNANNNISEPQIGHPADYPVPSGALQPAPSTNPSMIPTSSTCGNLNSSDPTSFPYHLFQYPASPLPTGGGKMKKEKKRTEFSSANTKVLEAAFSECDFARGTKRDELATTLGVPFRSITVWFQNKRAKLRKDKKRLDMLELAAKTGVVSNEKL